MVGFPDGVDSLLLGRVEKVDLGDWKADRVSVAVAEGLAAGDEGRADSFREEVLLDSNEEDEDDDMSVDFALACSVSTMVTDTETVVASGSSASAGLVTVW